MYFISQNVMNNLVRNLSEFSFVWMLDVLFLSVGHYLKFKREFKNENVFVILFVKFVLWIFKEFYFCKKCVSFEREVVVWVLLMCLDSRSMLCGCNLNSNYVVKKFTNMKSDFCLEGGVTCMLCGRSENDMRSYFDSIHKKREVLCSILWRVLYLLLIQRWVVPKLCFQCIHLQEKWLSAWKGGHFSLFIVAVCFCPSRICIYLKN